MTTSAPPQPAVADALPEPSARLERIEARLAYAERAVDDLSDIVTRQAAEIERLTRLCRQLRDKVGDLDAGWNRSPQDDRPPPHY